MGTSAGGGISSAPHQLGEHSGEYKHKDPSHIEQQSPKREFHNEAVIGLSSSPDVSTTSLAFPSNRDRDSLDGVATESPSAESPNKANLFHSISFGDIGRALGKCLGWQNESQGSNAAQGSRNPTSSDTSRGASGLPDVTIRGAATSGNGTVSEFGNVRFTGQGNALIPGDRFAAHPTDNIQLPINTPNGPVNVRLDSLCDPYNNGQIVRDTNGQSLVRSITITDQNGRTNTTDLLNNGMAGRTDTPQQGLKLDTLATNANALVLSRQDGARITYTISNTLEPQLTSVSARDGTRQYFRENPTDRNLVTTMVDQYINTEGTQLEQVRQRQGVSDTFLMQEYQMINGQRALVRTETETNVQIRADGQLIYQRHYSPEEINNTVDQQSKQFDRDLSLKERQELREQIFKELEEDKTWLIANDLPSAMRAFLSASSGKLFGGDDAKARNFANMYVTRIHDWQKKGYQTANDDQLAFSFRRLTDIYTKQRTGSAAQVSNEMINYHVGRALMCMGSPGLYNNQGQVGTCAVNSYRMACEYMRPQAEIDKFASIMLTGEAKGRKFRAAELSRKSYLGEDSFNYIMNNLCAKYRYGSKYSLNRSFPGTIVGGPGSQAAREFKMLSDGMPLPRTKAHHIKYGVKNVETMGGRHEQNWVGNLLENTWNGSGQKKTPTPRVEPVV